MPSQQPLYSSPLDKMADNLQTILSGAFLWMKNFVFWLLFYWSLFLRVQWTLNQYWLRQWLGAKQVPSHYLNQCSVDSLMHICSTRGRWVKYELVNKKTPFIGKKWMKNLKISIFTKHCAYWCPESFVFYNICRQNIDQGFILLTIGIWYLMDPLTNMI